MNRRTKIVDDSSAGPFPVLEIREDNQNDLYFTIVSKDGKRSDMIRLCGPVVDPDILDSPVI